MKELQLIYFSLLGYGILAAAFDCMFIAWVFLIGAAVTYTADRYFEDELEERRLYYSKGDDS